jgi:radical SAM superfamily enzyme YgiQ (UPF0313 family)
MTLRARKESLIREEALVMVGGVHCNFYPDSSLRDFGAHVAADGESEETILAILEQHRGGSLSAVPGILYRDGDQIRRTAKRPLMRTIDALPLPARHLLPRQDFVICDRLAGTDLTMAHVMSARPRVEDPWSTRAAASARHGMTAGARSRAGGHELAASLLPRHPEGLAVQRGSV